MKSSYSQLFNYAKGQYKQTNIMEDLAKIFGERSGIDPKHYSAYGILENLIYACSECDLLPKTDYLFLGFIKWCYFHSDKSENKIHINRDNITIEGLITTLLHIIRFAKVRGDNNEVLIEYDEPTGVLPREEA